MSDETQEREKVQEIIKGYLSEIHTQDTEKARLTKLMNDDLKKNEEYQALVKEKKAIDKKIKEFKESNQFGIQAKQCGNEISLIKESISEVLEVTKPIVSKMYSFFKKMFEKQVNELVIVTDAWNEVFLKVEEEEGN